MESFRTRIEARAEIESAMNRKDTFNRKPYEGFFLNREPAEGEKTGWFGQSQKTRFGDERTSLAADIESGKIEFIPFGDPRLEDIVTRYLLGKKENN
ncbi:MAG: hypothetical protein AAB809_01295 [Patescibacteria group bacterium]